MVSRQPTTSFTLNRVIAQAGARRGWLDQLTADQRREIEEIRAAYHAGPRLNLTKTLEILGEEWGLKVSIKTFGQWMRQKPVTTQQPAGGKHGG